MAINDILMAASGAGPDKTFIEDVFSTYLYTGNGDSGATQTVNNGIDLAGKGGMVWLKDRSSAQSNWISDTVRGNTQMLYTNRTDAQQTINNNPGGLTFNSNGFSLVGNPFTGFSNSNQTGETYASWTFRKAPKFFDVVTYTGDGVAGRTISHALGQAPGMIIVKCTSNTANWAIYHKTLGGTKVLNFTSGTQVTSATRWNNTDPTLSVFSVGSAAETNALGRTYVAYLFAHDTTTDGLIQCGSFTTNGSGNATVNLGWEPQYLLFKMTTGAAQDWYVVDNIRGWGALSTSNQLLPSTSDAENIGGSFPGSITSTGFNAVGSASQTYIYMAIRRGPMRTPTDATKVFKPVVRTGNSTQTSISGFGFSPDMFYSMGRTGSFENGNAWWDKLRGVVPVLQTSSTGAEVTTYSNIVKSFDMDGMTLLADSGAAWANYSPTPYVYHALKRAPGFFDVVCYTGTGAARTVNHNLGVAPELMIFKSRTDTAYGWITWHSAIPITSYVRLNNGDIPADLSAFPTWWLNSTYPTKSVISLGESVTPNDSGKNYVAYLFASCPGVSKVGSYTGNGSSQTINCGFAAGARYVLIKRTDSTGDWYVWDTARGIVTGNDPYIPINVFMGAEVTTDDTIDPDSTGFIVNQVAATNVNVNAATYIYLAIA